MTTVPHLPQPPAFQLQLLATPVLQRPDGGRWRLPPLDAALLLLLHQAGEWPRSAAAALFWPDREAANGFNNLRQRVFRLNQWAGDEVVAGDRSHLRLSPRVVVDLDHLTEACETDPQAAAGTVLGDAAYPADTELGQRVAAARAAFHAQRVQVLATQTEAHLAAGRLAQALPYAERLVRDDPLNEHGHRRLMRLHYRRGDRAAALAAYGHCAQVLQAELGVSPAAETQALADDVEGLAARPQPGPRPQAPALLRPPRLVGREAAWAQLVQWVAQHGRGMVVGAAGVGKSRLLGDFAAAQVGWTVVASRPGDSALPYALLVRLLTQLGLAHGVPATAWVREELARLLPAWGEAAAPAFSTLRLQQAVAEALAGWRAGTGTGVGVGVAGLAALDGVVVDDLHFADAASLELLAPLVSVGRAEAANGLRWLLASRPGDAAVPAFAQDWPRLVLPGLDVPGLQALLEALALPAFVQGGWARVLWERTGGNTLFTLQTLAALVARGAVAPPDEQGLPDATAAAPAPAVLPLPDDVFALLAQRLAGLSAPARALARLAAAAGNDFSLRLAARVKRCHVLDLADAWAELEDAQVVAGAGFTHDLLREAAQRSTPLAVAQPLHRDIAEALAEAGRPAASVAGHFDRAQAWPEAAAAYEAAAAQALACSAIQAQWQALDAAARCHRQHATPAALAAAFDCEHRSVEAMVLSLAAEQALARAEALVSAATTDHQRAAALEAKAYVLAERYEGGPALAAAQAALAAAELAGDARLALRARQRAAAACMRLGRADEALAMAESMADQLHLFSDQEQAAWLSEHALMLDHADRRREAMALFQRALDTAQRRGYWSIAADVLSSQSVAYMHLGQQRESVAALEQSMACARRAGSDEKGLLIDEMGLIGHLRDAGRFTEYLARAEGLPQALRDAGYAFWALNAENDLGLCFAWLGRPDLALRCLAAPSAEAPPVMHAARLLTLARAARDFGVPQQARPADQVAQAVALLAAAGGTGRSHVRLRVALETARDAAPGEGLRQAADIEAEALQRDNLMLAASACLLQMRLALARGQHAEAAAVAARLLARVEGPGLPASAYPPELWWWAHQALVQAEPAVAGQVLQRAVDWINLTAQQRLPVLYRDSFLQRNPVNAAVLAAARRWAEASPV